MYILVDEPPGGLQKEAFSALDDAFGTGEFSQGQAITVLDNAVESGRSSALFGELVGKGYIVEVE